MLSTHYRYQKKRKKAIKKKSQFLPPQAISAHNKNGKKGTHLRKKIVIRIPMDFPGLPKHLFGSQLWGRGQTGQERVSRIVTECHTVSLSATERHGTIRRFTERHEASRSATERHEREYFKSSL